MKLIRTEEEYRGLCKNSKTGQYDVLFQTFISKNLCVGRTREKAKMEPETYDAGDIQIQIRIVETSVSEWEMSEEKVS